MVDLIRLTELLHGEGTVAKIMKHRQMDPTCIPSNLLAFSEQKRPLIFWNLTSSCNLNCSQCYINADSKQSKDELSTQEAYRLIDEAVTSRTPLLMFSGGEPLVRPDFWELLSYAKDMGIRVAISSNGILITKAVAERLKENNVEYVGVSLDGAKASTHDMIRGQKGSFDSSINALKNCIEIGIKCGIRITATKDNYKEIPELINLAVKLGVPRFCLYWLVPSGRGKKEYKNKQLNKDQLSWALDKLYEAASTLDPKKIEILTVDAPQDAIYVLNRLKKEDPQRYEKAREILELVGDTCSAGDRVLNIDPQGNIYPCQFAQLEKLKVGNIKQEELEKMWNDSANVSLRNLRNKIDKLKGQCGRCVHKRICSGGCRIRAYHEYGDIWAEDPFCMSYQNEES